MPKVNMLFGQGTKRATITFDYIPQGLAVGRPLLITADQIRSGWVGNVSASQSNDCVLLATKIFTPGGAQATLNSVNPGLAVAAALPINCAVLVRKVTPVGNRGRMYVPGILESQVNSDGAIIGVALTAWQASMNGWYTELIADGILPLVTLGTGGEGGVAPVDGLQVDGTIATQRRRLRK